MEWGISTHLFAEQVLSFQVLSRLAGCGFRNLEVWAMRPHFDYGDGRVVEDLTGWVAQLGLSVAAVHAPFYFHLSELRQGRILSLAAGAGAGRRLALREVGCALRAASRLGAGVLVLHAEGAEEAAARRRFVEGVKMLLDEAGALGVCLALENTCAPGVNAAFLVELVEEIGGAGLGICLDVGHAHLVGEVTEALRCCAPYLLSLHVHDNHGFQDEHLLPGKGSVAWQKVMHVLQQVGFAGLAVLELRVSRGVEGVLSDLKQGNIGNFECSFMPWGKSAERG